MADPFILECSGLPPGARVVAFEGTEEISTTYRYEVDLLVDPDADLGDAVGASATLTVHPDGATHRTVHGIIGSAGVMENMGDADLYRVVLVPRVRDVLGHDRHSRVFVREAVPAIVQTLLREAGFQHDDCEFRLLREYEPLDFVCQYRESTLDFLLRWMERDGIYFYFAHDGARERLVILDDKGQHSPHRVHAPFHKSVGGQEPDGLRRFRAERHTVPGRVQVDDYDYLRPALPVRGQAAVEGGNHGELRERGAKVTTPKEASRIARLRAEGLRSRQTIFHGEGRVHDLHAGELFTVSGHPRASLDGDYLCTRLHVRGHHTGDLGPVMKEALGREDEPDDVLRVDLQAIGGHVQFRPELRTSPPRVSSMESGTVEGDVESEYAQLDDHGRYLVKFRFDEREGRGSQSSARLRMMQPHAGNPEGMHFPLRKGTEVLVAFLGGDPDRPVIAGAVPNAVNPAVVHGGNATKNVIHTGGGNKIVMEDTEGRQYIHISSPHRGSYIHIGSPFNPQYNKVTNTTGTSLTYTQDISTSVTGTDAQTIVEDARVTIIGRSRIVSPTDETAGAEINALLGTGFVGVTFEQDSDVLLEQIAADAFKAQKDANASALTTGTPAGPPPPVVTSSNLSNVTAAIEQLLTDMQTLAADASSYKKIATSTSPPPPAGFVPTGFDVTGWVSQVNAAVVALTDAEMQLGATPPDWAAINGTGVPPTGGSVAVAQTAAISAASGAPHATPAANQPDFPSPNATPTYILLPHAPSHNTTLSVQSAAPSSSSPAQQVDAYITSLTTLSPPGPEPEQHDTTALDVLDTTAYSGVLQAGPPRSTVPTPETDTSATGLLRPTGQAYPLNPGSDVKIVGGDNVTLAKKDARSHTLGHSYGLVQAGQTTVVYAPSKYPGAVSWWVQDGDTKLAAFQRAQANLDAAQAALASFQAQNNPPPDPSDPSFALYQIQLENLQAAVAAALGPRDQALAALQPLLSGMMTRPSPLVPAGWSAADIAQTSTAYGNTRSWVNGNTDATVTGDTSSTIDGSATTTIKNWRNTFVKGSTNTTLGSDLGNSHNTFVMGNRALELVGTDTSAIVGAKASLVAGANASLVLGATASGYIGARLDWSVGPHLKVKNLHIDTLALDIQNIATMLTIEAPLLEILSATMNVDAVTFSSINTMFSVMAEITSIL